MSRPPACIRHDVGRLIELLHRPRDQGNTLVVVEHDHDLIRVADHVVDLGPGAGSSGGEVLYSGSIAGLDASRRLGHGRLPLRSQARASARPPPKEIQADR